MGGHPVKIVSFLLLTTTDTLTLILTMDILILILTLTADTLTVLNKSEQVRTTLNSTLVLISM